MLFVRVNDIRHRAFHLAYDIEVEHDGVQIGVSNIRPRRNQQVIDGSIPVYVVPRA
jgi:hypothetical protein